MGTINSAMNATSKGFKKVEKYLKSENKRERKAMEVATRVEGFRLKNLLQREIRQGVPGGQKFKPLSYIARRAEKQVLIRGGKTRKQNPNRKPLARLALGVRYQVQRKFPFRMAVGFVSSTTGSHKTSSTWRRWAKMHQTGFSHPVSKAQRYFLARRGAQLGVAEGGDTPFFLRKTTQKFETPARPIIKPFWAAHRQDALENIQNNFSKKIRGQRI